MNNKNYAAVPADKLGTKEVAVEGANDVLCVFCVHELAGQRYKGEAGVRIVGDYEEKICSRCGDVWLEPINGATTITQGEYEEELAAAGSPR